MREREGKQIRGQTGHIGVLGCWGLVGWGGGACKRDYARECLRKRQILFPHRKTKKKVTDRQQER